MSFFKALFSECSGFIYQLDWEGQRRPAEYVDICGTLTNIAHQVSQDVLQVQPVETRVFYLERIPDKVVVQVFGCNSLERPEKILQPAVQIVDLLQVVAVSVS